MTSLAVQSIKETHESFDWIEHEFTIIFNVLYVSLYAYYLLYEISAYFFAQMGYPQLPTFDYFDDSGREGWLQIFNFAIKLLGLVGAASLAIGSASWKLTYTMFGCSICLPLVGHDIYLVTKGELYGIDVDNFLLFQTLFETTLRILRILATLSSSVSIFHYIFFLPPGISFGNFL